MSRMFQPDDQVHASVPLQVLTLGKDHIVSFSGTSQFTAQGVSACGLAAFNFARIGFRIEQSKGNLADVLNELSKKEVIEEIVAICAGWSSNLHLEVDDIHDLPLFGRSLKPISVEYGRPGLKHFQILLENMKKIEKSAVMIITRPPEIIACFKFFNAPADSRSSTGTLDNPLFVVFDSHPRPSHPQGAGLSFSTSIDHTARTLSDILPAIDESIFDASDFQWQAQLLSNCSAHVYVGRHQRKDHEEAIAQSSLAVLALRAQLLEVKDKNEALESDNRRLRSEVHRLRAAVAQEQMRAKQDALSAMDSKNRTPWYPGGWVSHALAGPSRTSRAGVGNAQEPDAYSRSASTTSDPRRRPARTSPDAGASGAHSIFADNPPPVPSKRPPTHDDFDLGFQQFGLDDKTERVARQLQREFESEDRRLRQEHEDLARYVQTTFQCNICMDELPEDDVAKVDDCKHTLCRTCLREFVISKIQEHRYPIYCPLCSAGEQSKAHPAVISRVLIEQLGVSEEQFEILTEMELAKFTIQIHCRQCRRPSVMDREDYTKATTLQCPDCCHVWCKKCEQAIVSDGPKHSCDGTSELDHLMQQHGWKRCPNCKTPIQKETGCNHMSCIVPACNTHFCYVCGGVMVRFMANHATGSAQVCRCSG